MKDTIVDILKIVTPISVAVLIFAQGLDVSPAAVLNYFKDRGALLVRSLIAALVLVPAAALGLILLLKPAPGVGVGLAILVSCPPAPIMVTSAPKKGANAAFMATLHLSLAALAFLTVPAILDLLSIPLGFSADVHQGAMFWILARTILLPLGLGLIVRASFPAAAERFSPILGKIAMIGVLVVLAVAVSALYPALLAMDRWSYLVIATVSVVSLAIGHLLGPSDPHEKTSLAVECGVRHPALAIAIAAANFSQEKALPVLIPCVLTFIAIATVYMSWRRKSLST